MSPFKLRLKLIDIVFIIGLLLLTILSIDLLFNTEHQNAIENISKYEQKINNFSLDNARLKAELAALNAEFKQYEGATIIKDKSEEDLKKDIAAFCQENMAPYKRPKTIEFVDELPLTAVGKVDKKALR